MKIMRNLFKVGAMLLVCGIASIFAAQSSNAFQALFCLGMISVGILAMAPAIAYQWITGVEVH